VEDYRVKASNNMLTIKSANAYLILDAIRRSGPMTIDQMTRLTRLSRPTVLQILEDLSERGVVCCAGPAESSGGRQPMLYQIDTTKHFAIGVDFEFPPMRLAVIDLQGNVRLSKTWDCSYSMDKETIIERLVEAIRASVLSMNLTLDNIVGIGLGIPGTINLHENRPDIISRIPQWNRAPLSEILTKEFPVPVHVRNDAHLMAMGAYNDLALNDGQFLFIAYRTGIGMAIVRKGRLMEGEYGNAGYIGHTTVDINGDFCPCGQRGCLETFSSKRAVEHKYALLSNLDQKIGFDEILRLADHQDKNAALVLADAATYFGIALANAVKMLDISTVIIGDLDCEKDQVFVRTIEETINKYCASYAINPVQVIPWPTDERRNATGAAIYALEKFFDQPRLRLSV
jgi:predicted NBD/HSP70 family sugar kinase